jgi:hypothetical protein
MAFMQSAHRGHEPNALALAPQFSAESDHLVSGSDGVHGIQQLANSS